MIEIKVKEQDSDNKWNFSPITNNQLHTVLKQRTKKELLLICKSFKIRVLSHKTKGEIQQIIQSDIYLYLKHYIALMNDHHMLLLSQLLMPDFTNQKLYLSKEHIQFFISFGILYPVSYLNIDTFIIPKEIKSFLMRLFQNDFTELYDRNNRVVSLAYQYCEQYGLIEYQTFHYLYQKKYPTDDILHDFKEILELESLLNSQLYCEESTIYHPLVNENRASFLDLRKLYDDVTYYDYSEMNVPYDVYYLQDQFVLKQLKKTIKRLSKQQQELLLTHTFRFLNFGQSIQLLNAYIVKQLPEVTEKELIKFYKRINQKQSLIRLWYLKGNRTCDT